MPLESGGGGGRGYAPVAEYLGYGVVSGEGAGLADCGRAYHQAPPGGGVYVRQRIYDLYLGNRVGFGSAQRLRQLEGKESRVSDGGDGGGREGA